MEDAFLTKEEAFDRESLDQLSLAHAINVSLEEKTHWQMIPAEVKVKIFSWIPEEIKNLILINHECYALTKELFFLKRVAVLVIDKNLEKAANLYAQAFEEDNTILTQALLNAHLDKRLIATADLTRFSKESSLDSNFDPVIINEIGDDTTAFMKAIIKLFPQAARIIFIKAAGKDLSLINICFDNRIDINLNNDYNSEDTNALMEAAYTGHTEIIQLLTANGADVNAKNKSESTPLMYSAIYGHIEASEYLLNLGAEVNARNIFGMTPLIIAARFGNIELIKFLLHKKADIEGKPYGKGENDLRASSLIIAAQYGQEEALNILLNNGAQINAADKNSNNALHMASFNGHYKIVTKLVESGCPINAKNKKGLTPLMLVAKVGNLAMVKFLLDLNADPNIQTGRYKKGKTALIYACLFGHVEIVEHLIPMSNVNAEDENEATAIKLVLNKVKALKDFSDINAQNYLRIIELLNQDATAEGSLSTLDKMMQSTYDTFYDPQLPWVTLAITGSLTLAAIIQSKYQ